MEILYLVNYDEIYINQYRYVSWYSAVLHVLIWRLKKILINDLPYENGDFTKANYTLNQNHTLLSETEN